MIKLSKTLSLYLGKNYLLNTLAVLTALLSIIYLLDILELLRRANKTGDIPLGIILQMGLLKLPEIGQTIFPFAILFSALWTFWQLNRRSELVVLRASGFSVWQFLAPIVLLAALIGALQIGLINPAGALLIGKYDRLESEFLKKQSSQIALFKEGLWLRQEIDPDKQQSFKKTHNVNLAEGYIILHARKIAHPSWQLLNVTVFYLDTEDQLLMRLDAKSATLEKNLWTFNDVLVNSNQTPPTRLPAFTLPTTLTIKDIEDSFSSPQSMSFWNLPGHIQTLRETGFETGPLIVHYHNLLAQPLFLMAMVILAATVSMRPPRFGGTLVLIASGLFIGLGVFFLSSFLQALGASNQLPPPLAAWAPSIIFILFGLSALIHLEDG
ncbi:MAG: LPS export ABC transporter permease LptG [Alphaproteobacteria bacterium]|nr:LPS export ABC transporter permease LptG [Alphaproteobacteria bacterium]MCB1651516.1 LPS export ABC transporter permease LptG [Alphaproteobacteria bacterium]